MRVLWITPISSKQSTQFSITSIADAPQMQLQKPSPRLAAWSTTCGSEFVTAKVLCFASAKGGAGKTSLAASFAQFICAIGKSCLIIDCDPATHGLTLLYLNEVADHAKPNAAGLFDLRENIDVSQALPNGIVELTGEVHFLPASYRFDASTYSRMESTPPLKRAVDFLRPKYDIILLDAQAGCDEYSRAAMKSEVSDEVVIVSEYDPLSAAGVEMMKRVIGDDLSHARTWILYNKILPEFVRDVGEFMVITKYLPPIPWNVQVVRSYAQRKLALDLTQGNDFTLAIIQTARRLLASTCTDEIDTWVAARAYALKAPLEEQSRLADEELAQVQLQKRRFIRKRRTRTILATSVFAYLGLGVAIFIPYSSSTIDLSDELELLTLASAVIIGFATLFLALQRSINYNNKEEEEAPYNDQISQLEEKRTRLQTLREADDHTLFREFRSSKTDPADRDAPAEGGVPSQTP